jgi:hypothetical protein
MVMERDLKSFQKRREAFDRMTREWSEGKWKPEEWGFQAAKPAAEPLDALRETTWEQYVRQHIERFELDKTQAEAAYSMLRELVARATDYRRSIEADLKANPPPDPAKDPRFAPLSRLFDELVSRLDRLPTAAQRSAAENAAKETDGAALPGASEAQ